MIAPPGFQVGPYTVLRPAGRGGMGDVFIATDSRTDRRVALKLVPLGDDAEARQVVEAEREGAEYQKQLWPVYRHVPEVYEYGADDSYFFIAMELLEGQNLSDLLARGPLAPPRALTIAIQICRFLEAAHTLEPTIDGRRRRSLLHGDLKPRNVRILENDEVKVFDFGAAKALSFSRKVTRHDFGSIAYLSPERIESGEIDAHADFWGVGVILYEMLTGEQPFRAEDTRRLESLIRARRPAPALDTSCPIGLRAIAAKLLAGPQEDRYASAAAIRGDLERVVSGEPTCAEREGWPARAHDEGVTHRVAPRAEPDDLDATRRTVKPPDVAKPPAVPMPPTPPSTPVRSPAPSPTSGPKPRTRTARFLRTALLLFGLLIVINELRVAALAGGLADAVATQELGDLEVTWARYRELRDGTLGIGVSGLQRALLTQTTALADRVIANYRTPSPSVREAQWRAARRVLAQALTAGGGDTDLRAALRYCDGHLHRINGEARKTRRQGPEAQREFAEALVAFREAAQLRPEWADPYLGLMRTFIYGLDDVERGEDALAQAVKRGYKPGDRETAQLAEGHRVRADALIRSAREVSGLAQELQYLKRAADAYRRSVELYAAAPAFSGATRQVRAVQRELSATEGRIALLSQAATEPAAARHEVEAAAP